MTSTSYSEEIRAPPGSPGNAEGIVRDVTKIHVFVPGSGTALNMDRSSDLRELPLLLISSMSESQLARSTITSSTTAM